MMNSNPKKVLFVSLSGIGNLLMQLPAIRLLKEAHPDWHITVWVAPRGTAELALSQRYIDEVIEMPIQANIPQHIKNVITLYRKRYDYGIVLSPGQLIKSALYLKFADIRNRIGHTYPLGNNDSSLFLTYAITEQGYTHDIEQNIRLLEFFSIYIHEEQSYTIEIPEQYAQEARAGIDPDAVYVGLHAGSAKGYEWKQWPEERFAEVAHGLMQKNPAVQFLIFGGPQEDAQKHKLAAAIGENAHSISASLMATAAYMRYCKFVLSNDSGLMHLAAASGVPVFGLFGPTDENLTGPRGSQSVVVRAPGTKPVYSTEKQAMIGQSAHDTILAITVDQVLDTIGNSIL